jgi:hypothetical protein
MGLITVLVYLTVMAVKMVVVAISRRQSSRAEPHSILTAAITVIMTLALTFVIAVMNTVVLIDNDNS